MERDEVTIFSVGKMLAIGISKGGGRASQERYKVSPRQSDIEAADCNIAIDESLDCNAKDPEDDENDDDDDDEAQEDDESQQKHQRRHRLARKLDLIRKFQIAHLHQLKSYHLIDTLFTFVLGNMTVVSWVLGGGYYHRKCAKPLASFLILIGFLTPFAAVLPILLRQWYYLHLRLNLISLSIFVMSFFYCVMLLVGQQWAFESSPTNCDADLSEATNICVFVLYVSTGLYVCKVLWYLSLRVKYKYKELCLSCIRDPFPNAYRLNDEEVAKLEAQVDGAESPNKSPRTSPRRGGGAARGVGIRLELFRHENSIRESLNKLATVAPTRPHVPKISVPASVHAQRAIAKAKAKLYPRAKYAWTDVTDDSHDQEDHMAL